MYPSLCLGSAQFGLAYGITNSSGQVPEEEVKNILRFAYRAGFKYIDTAQAYGQSETVLGSTMISGQNFHVISKLPAQDNNCFTVSDTMLWEKNFFSSLKRMGLETLDSFLLHSSADLNKPGSKHLKSWLFSLKDRGLVKRLGMSIYSSKDLKNVHHDILDLVQLPLSLFDQRLLQDGTINSLRSQGTAIHIRSVYLQGLLLTPIQGWPKWAPKTFLNHHSQLEKLAASRNCKLIDLALGFAKSQLNVESVVVGVCSLQECTELFDIWANPSPWESNEWRNWAFEDEKILDPRTWLK